MRLHTTTLAADTIVANRDALETALAISMAEPV